MSCAPASAPPARSPPSAEPPGVPPERAWRRVARADVDLPAQLALEGASEALARCGEVRPCVVERWAPADAREGRALTLLRRGDDLRALDDPDASTPWRTRWTVVNGALDPCLGAPLSVEPAEDPAGVRELVEIGPERWWRLRLSGHNRCRLAGVLELSTTRDEVRAEGLHADGLPWREGGRQRALALLRADLRAQAQSEWESLSPAEREEWARLLARDPEAAALLEELRARELAEGGPPPAAATAR